MLLKNTSKLCDRLLSWADVLTGVLCDMGGVVCVCVYELTAYISK